MHTFSVIINQLLNDPFGKHQHSILRVCLFHLFKFADPLAISLTNFDFLFDKELLTENQAHRRTEKMLYQIMMFYSLQKPEEIFIML